MDKTTRLRRDLVRHLKKQKHITSRPVEAAFRAVPRHLFVPEADALRAYSDEVISVKADDEGRSISSSSQPAIMAIMLEQLDLQSGANVLEIGAGTGYNAALMAHIVGEEGRITTIDIDEDLVQNARAHLKKADVQNVQVIQADGYQGYSANAPYDRIILTVSPWDITPQWIDQLKPDGYLVVPMMLADQSGQASIKFRKDGTGLISEGAVPCGFMPLRGKHRVTAYDNAYRLDDHLFMTAYEGFPVEPEAVRDLLDADYEDVYTDVSMAVVSGFQTWGALQEPHFINISAEEGALEKVPYFAGEAGRYVATQGLTNGKGLALMMRPPDVGLPQVADFVTAFYVYVRSYGIDKRPAKRLIQLLKSWEAAGKPGIKQMQVRLMPLEADYTPQPGEAVVEKTWHKLIVHWRKGES